MTRVEQWWRRRMRYLHKSRTRNNRRRRNYYRQSVPHPPNSVNHPGSWPAPTIMDKQPWPRVSKALYDVQVRRYRGWQGIVFFAPVGRASPPRVKINRHPLSPPPTHHDDKSQIDWYFRAVQVIGKCGDRDTKAERLSWRALIYWRKRGAWPAWDPRGRVPVEIKGVGPDDPW